VLLRIRRLIIGTWCDPISKEGVAEDPYIRISVRII
jgi:hypothetical protein